VERAQVLYHELVLKGGDCALKKAIIGRREHDVVNVEEDVDSVVSLPMNEHGRARLGLDEAKGYQVGDEADCTKPSAPA
jgi:hypothetical protein